MTLAGSFEPNALLVSIAAGLSMKFLREKSGLQKVIRVMPNLPATVQCGVSGMYVPEGVSTEEAKSVRVLLESFSTVIDCHTEDQIDAMTALSASGPGYYFRILEIMMAEGQKFGFSPEDAQKIALETLRGAAELAKTSGEDFSVLRERVTSKGGTTEAALKKFTELQLEEILQQGVQAAFQRAKELGQ